MATLAVVPPPLNRLDPIFFGQLIEMIEDVFGLDDIDRLVLIGVLQHVPSTSSSIISRITALNPDQVKLLAEILMVGLLNARSMGGSFTHNLLTGAHVSSSCSAIAGGVAVRPLSPEVTDLAVGELFAHLQIEPFPFAPTNIINQSWDITPGGGVANRVNRPSRLGHDQPISRSSLTPRTARRTPDAGFWLLVAIVLGPTLRGQLYGILYGSNSFSTANWLAMDCALCRLFVKGAALLLPCFPEGRTFNSATCRSYDVAFRWREHTRDPKLSMTLLPQLPEEQILTSTDGQFTSVQAAPRPIMDGDVFRFWTNDTLGKPLPHPLLLSTHAMLWRMVSAAGLGTTSTQLKRRIAYFEGERPVDDNRFQIVHPERQAKKKRLNVEVPQPHSPPPPPPPPPMQPQDAPSEKPDSENPLPTSAVGQPAEETGICAGEREDSDV